MCSAVRRRMLVKGTTVSRSPGVTAAAGRRLAGAAPWRAVPCASAAAAAGASASAAGAAAAVAGRPALAVDQGQHVGPGDPAAGAGALDLGRVEVVLGDQPPHHRRQHLARAAAATGAAGRPVVGRPGPAARRPGRRCRAAGADADRGAGPAAGGRSRRHRRALPRRRPPRPPCLGPARPPRRRSDPAPPRRPGPGPRRRPRPGRLGSGSRLRLGRLGRLRLGLPRPRIGLGAVGLVGLASAGPDSPPPAPSPPPLGASAVITASLVPDVDRLALLDQDLGQVARTTATAPRSRPCRSRPRRGPRPRRPGRRPASTTG